LQIAKLTMASDYHRNPRQPCRGNQGKVSIEIECMGNINSFFAEMSRQPDASAHGSPPEQASSESKFRHIVKFILESSSLGDTSQVYLKLFWSQIPCKYSELTLGPAGLERVRH
jgi:hypothetical protein